MLRAAVFAAATAAAAAAAVCGAGGARAGGCGLPVIQLGPLKEHVLCVNETVLERLEVGDAALLAELRTLARVPESAPPSLGKGFFRLPCVDEQVQEAEDHVRGLKRRSSLVPIPQAPTQQKLFESLVAEIEADDIKNMDQKLSDTKMFFTRYYKTQTGREAATMLYDDIRTQSGPPGHSVIFSLWSNHSFEQPSITARFLGSSADAAGRIIIGAHIDSIGRCRDCESPGADDDASGSSTIYSIFKALRRAGWRPRRDVEFHWYAAEEGGLLGSADIAGTYANVDINVQTMLQFDMTMYGDNNQSIGLIGDYTNPDLTEFIKTLAETYTDLKVEMSKCGYACSDHASWDRNGYRAAFPFERPFGKHNPYIHTGDDFYSKLNLHRGVQYARLGLAYLLEMDAAN